MADSTDIFRTLFGGSSKDAPLPLFVDNPFRRQPKSGTELNQKTLPHDSLVPNVEGKPSSNGAPDSSRVSYSEMSKRRNSVADSAEQKAQGSKKRKKEAEGVEIARKSDEIEENKKKKKRKRVEIEEEYEARKYGLPDKNEEVKKIESCSASAVGMKRKTLDDSSETMVVSEEAYDDESKLQRTVFVGNLPLKLKKKVLLKEFRGYGEIESVRIRSVPLLDTKIPRKGAIIKGKINEAIDSVHAYVVFKGEKSAEAALMHNMAEVGGNHIRVDRACPPRKKLKGENAPLYDNKRTVFIGNLPFDVKDEDLYQLFAGIDQLSGSVEAVRVIRDPHSSMGKGIAYVLFKTREAANLAIKRKNLKLRDRVLRLCHSKSDATPSKRQNRDGKFETSRLSKRSAVASRESDKPKSKARPASLSYQGLQATKSGVQKKMKWTPNSGDSRKLPLKRGREAQPVVHKSKRPTVVARKASLLKGNTSLQSSGKKRKLEGGTPGSTHRTKKVRRVE